MFLLPRPTCVISHLRCFSTFAASQFDLDSVSAAISGQLYHCPIRGSFEYHADSLVLVDLNGEILDVLDSSEHPDLMTNLEQAGLLTTLNESQYLLPGMVDLHIHAPQYPQLGKGLDLPLYEWLQEYTFPLEARFEDVEYAREVYETLIGSLLANGTTTGVYFGSLHSEASLALAEICLSQGQRAYVGKVNMDNPSECPSFYIEETEQGLQEAEEFIQSVRLLPGNESKMVHPVITPRFVPSCTEEMMRGLGDLVQQYQCHVQTHASESDWARGYSTPISDIEIYQDMGLLTERTILAHCIFLDDVDMQEIKASGAAIAHCPLSNMYFGNAAMKTREALDRGLKVGLGTDLAGSPTPSIFHTCLDAVSHSRTREEGTNSHLPAPRRGEPGTRITFLEAYWMATVGGGLAVDANIGLFKKGYAFDAIVVDANASDSDVVVHDQDSPQDTLEKLICLTRRGNVRNVWVQGILVIDQL